MIIDQLKPSHFTEHPSCSIAQKVEFETAAQNINIIRARLGDGWTLTREQFRWEREKDGKVTEHEMKYFDRVIGLISSPKDCIDFCHSWRVAATKLLTN